MQRLIMACELVVGYHCVGTSHLWPYQRYFILDIALHELSVHYFTRARYPTTAKVGFAVDEDFKPLLCLEITSKGIMKWMNNIVIMILPTSTCSNL